MEFQVESSFLVNEIRLILKPEDTYQISKSISEWVSTSNSAANNFYTSYQDFVVVHSILNTYSDIWKCFKSISRRQILSCCKKQTYLDRFFQTSPIPQSLEFPNIKDWVKLYLAIVLTALCLAVELLREPIKGQLKTITNKELGSESLSICTS